MMKCKNCKSKNLFYREDEKRLYSVKKGNKLPKKGEFVASHITHMIVCDNCDAEFSIMDYGDEV